MKLFRKKQLVYSNDMSATEKLRICKKLRYFFKRFECTYSDIYKVEDLEIAIMSGQLLSEDQVKQVNCILKLKPIWKFW